MDDFVVVPIDDDFIPIIIPAEPLILPTTEVEVPGLQGPPGTTSESAPFSKNDSTVVLGIVPAGAKIRECVVKITELFSDPLAQLSVGTDADPSLLVAPEDVHMQRVGEYVFEGIEEITVATELKLFVSTTGSNGAGKAFITYS